MGVGFGQGSVPLNIWIILHAQSAHRHSHTPEGLIVHKLLSVGLSGAVAVVHHYMIYVVQ